jgi:hypothetical protein
MKDAYEVIDCTIFEVDFESCDGACKGSFAFSYVFEKGVTVTMSQYPS